MYSYLSHPNLWTLDWKERFRDGGKRMEKICVNSPRLHPPSRLPRRFLCCRLRWAFFALDFALFRLVAQRASLVGRGIFD